MLLSIVAWIQGICLCQLGIFCINISFSHSVHIGNQIPYRIIIYSPAQLNLSLYLVTLSAGNITHSITKATNTNIKAFVVGYSHILPSSDFSSSLLILPMTINNLVVQLQSGIDIAVFSVTMSTLVEIHIIKIYGVIRNLIKILSSQVEQRLLQQLGTTNPVFSWGEGMSPNHDTSHIVIVIRILHELSNTVGSGHNPFEYDFVRQLASTVEIISNFLGVLLYSLQCFLTIKMLAACYKPKLIILYI